MSSPNKPIVKQSVRLPLDLHIRIKQLATQEQRSFNAQLIILLRDALNRTRIKRKQ